MTKLIDQIELPSGLRALDVAQLNQVASELRDELIDVVSGCGGHFASSLGAAEISVALHHAFETPHDRIVWDVGHQAYIHKMLTGRRASLGTIRKLGGISGFLRRSESEYDAFGAGHAGTSISAAVGMSVALQDVEPKRYVVAVIGDGSITAGMALEALNNAGALALRNLIVVLNDNEMSISPNVGAMSRLFSLAVTSKTSTMARSGFKSLHKRGYVPDFIYKAIDRAEEATLGFMSPPAMLFESYGFRYIGPVDGHNIQSLVTALDRAKQQDVPVLIHARTTKGKGYEPAEIDPVKWHGVNPFDRSRGEFAKGSTKNPPPAPAYQSVFAEALIELAREDKRIMAITAAMASGTGLDKFAEAFPERFFDVGICEQHAVTFAAGLACEGLRPVCAIYSTFLQRAYDQVIHDVCVQNLPVVFALDRAGMVGNDGETHQGLFDISYLRTVPNLTLMSPRDESEFRDMLYTALRHNGPVAVRYPRGSGIGCELRSGFEELPIGRAEILRRGEAALIIAYGPLVNTALYAADVLEEENNLKITVVNARFAKPLDNELLQRELLAHEVVCVLEDNALQGGFGSALLEMINEQGLQLRSSVKRFGAKDEFVPHASQAEQQEMHGYSPLALISYLRDSLLKQRRPQRKVANL